MENAPNQELEHLQNIEHELESIDEKTGGTWRSFFSGLLQGVGAVVGGVIAVTLIGWILSLFGVIPGLQVIATSLHSSLDSLHSR